MLQALPYMRYAVRQAAKEGDVQIGILAVNPAGGGRVMAQFRAPEFFEELALILDAPAQIEEDDMDAAAVELLDKFNLRKPDEEETPDQ